jgi:hypothetical protein
MNTLQPNKLLLSKWPAVNPIAKEKHFLVSKVVAPELEGGCASNTSRTNTSSAPARCAKRYCCWAKQCKIDDWSNLM